MEKTLELEEPYVVPDTYCSGLAEVEDIGGGDFRFTFFTRRRGICEVTARLIMPADAVPEAMRMTARKAHICACEAARGAPH